MKEGFNHETKSSLYIDLDSLYDTRLAILEAVDPAYAAYLLTHDYYTREYDKFIFIDEATYDLIWRNRDINYLKSALTTPMVDFVAKFVSDSIERRNSSPFDSNIEIYLNIWPYKMSTETAKQFAKPILKIIDGENIALNIVNMKPSDVTIKWCREKLAVMVMYEVSEWLESNFTNKSSGFKVMHIPDITVIVPELYNGVAKTKEEIHSLQKQYGNLFRFTEEALKLFIGLAMFPIESFCADIPEEMLTKIKERYPDMKLVDDTKVDDDQSSL